MKKNTFPNKELLERNPEIKPFSCKYCNETFSQVHDVKEHIKIHASISKANNEATISSDTEDSFTNDDINTVEILSENLKLKNDDHFNTVNISQRRRNMSFKSNDNFTNVHKGMKPNKKGGMKR